jgi:hypothetical protein
MSRDARASDARTRRTPTSTRSDPNVVDHHDLTRTP